MEEIMIERDCRNCCFYHVQSWNHNACCIFHDLFEDGMIKILDGNEALNCMHYEVKKCKTCGHFSDFDFNEYGLCTCDEKCIDDDYVEIAKEKEAVDCDGYYYSSHDD